VIFLLLVAAVALAQSDPAVGFDTTTAGVITAIGMALLGLVGGFMKLASTYKVTRKGEPTETSKSRAQPTAASPVAQPAEEPSVAREDPVVAILARLQAVDERLTTMGTQLATVIASDSERKTAVAVLQSEVSNLRADHADLRDATRDGLRDAQQTIIRAVQRAADAAEQARR